MKETPNDFFLTHPNDRYAGTIARPTVMEFDIAGDWSQGFRRFRSKLTSARTAERPPLAANA